ncbi:hypothetical protein [Hymenobacter crusticola]|uniref:STAS/SEC14 domain-containing protein n=1 Tax=Hymenobacter crusticola TaxID=1770526 RepID=A0A243W7N8_9BACT|nr:hypothetical protein [Hymenobacter crusticola]OUJ71044.1 hypothetical protein BXP70_23055 [Hymenobacter crusticola]
MLLSATQFSTGGTCAIHYEESAQWLHATWSGWIGHEEALQGAAGYLDQVEAHPSAFLLNNNLALRGPWFNSVDWLRHAWLPQAQRLGLRYIAHVVQADKGSDILSLTQAERMNGLLELQLFHDLAEAQDWLRSCQQQPSTPSGAASLTCRQDS